MHIYSTR